MPGIGIGVSNAFKHIGGIPFKSDLLLDYFERQVSNLVDSKENKIGKILPACASFNGVDQYIYSPSISPRILGSAQLDIIIKFKTTGTGVNQYIAHCGGNTITQLGFSVRIDTTNKLIFSSTDGSVQANQTIATINTTTYYTLELSWNGLTGGTLSWTLNGVPGSGTATRGWIGNSTTPLIIAARQGTGLPDPTVVTQPFKGEMSYFKLNTIELLLNGKGRYCYSADGNYALDYRNGTTIASATFGNTPVYNEIGSVYPMDYGYKIYKKSGELDEYVPYNGIISHLTGYETTTKDTFSGNTKSINVWPCYVDFDYSDEGGAFLDIFDRSNTDRCTDFARGDLYDANNPYRWFITEISDPRIYFDYFTPGYAGKMFGKVITELYESAYYIKELNKLLVYTTDKTGADQYRVIQYCKINVFAL